MAKLFDADALFQTMKNADEADPDLATCWSRGSIRRIIEGLPTIEAAPVVHGRWIEVRGRYICSECKSRASLHSGGIGQNLSHYCPNCGAKMDGGVSDG